MEKLKSTNVDYNLIKILFSNNIFFDYYWIRRGFDGAGGFWVCLDTLQMGTPSRIFALCQFEFFRGLCRRSSKLVAMVPARGGELWSRLLRHDWNISLKAGHSDDLSRRRGLFCRGLDFPRRQHCQLVLYCLCRSWFDRAFWDLSIVEPSLGQDNLIPSRTRPTLNQGWIWVLARFLFHARQWVF